MKYDYTDLLENLYDGVYFTDHDRKITFWNKAAERITGFTAGEVIGQHCSDNILIHVPGSLLSRTVSIGATMATPDDTRESLMKRADLLLYKSKNRGKNCMTAE